MDDMRKFILYILLFVSTIGCGRPSEDQIVATPPDSVDYEPLVALYQALGGEGWKNNTNWCSSRPLSEWYGVYTYQGRVYAINLFDNNLVGTLPAEPGRTRTSGCTSRSSPLKRRRDC